MSVEVPITVVIPIRLNDAHGDALDRLGYLAEDTTLSRHARVMVVDDGSPSPFAARLKERCAQVGFEHVRLDTEGQVFSIGRCRNEAAMRASTRYIFFQDIDLIPPDGFYEKLAREIDIVGLPRHANNMIMIPVAYLTEAATAAYLADREPGKFQRYLDRVIARDRDVFEKFSTGTSACLYDRYYFLSCGGNQGGFSGWGFEDLEFNTRVALDSGRYPVPDNWLLDISSFDLQTNYHGWKSVYRLFGDRSFLKGLLMFHAWHPVVHETNYRRRKENNRKVFLEQMERFQKTREHPHPLPSFERGRTLLFRKNAFTFARELQPLLGEVRQEDEKLLSTRQEFVRYVRDGRFDRILFHNPYANMEMQRLYNWAREEGLPYIVAERGALNDSILFDPTGFLADSSRFEESLWNHPLDDGAEARIHDYIGDERAGGKLLEAQGARGSAAGLREKLNLTRSDRVTLVCLQRPGDTATRFFEGQLGSYQEFVAALSRLSRELPKDHRLLVKVHPLESDFPDILGEDVTEHHLYDLLDIADRLVVYNSGTGVQAMMWDLPVITCGRAFYNHTSLVRVAGTYDELKDAIVEGAPVDRAARRRFLSYLVERYYSFGKLTTRQTRMENGDRMTATSRIDYDRLRFDGITQSFVRNGEALDDWQSMLFDRYLWRKREQVLPLNKPVQRASRDNLADRIYKASRNVPVAEPLIDLFVPVYEWLAKRRKGR